MKPLSADRMAMVLEALDSFTPEERKEPRFQAWLDCLTEDDRDFLLDFLRWKHDYVRRHGEASERRGA